jgi:hypothetical protein
MLQSSPRIRTTHRTQLATANGSRAIIGDVHRPAVLTCTSCNCPTNHAAAAAVLPMLQQWARGHTCYNVHRAKRPRLVSISGLPTSLSGQLFNTSTSREHDACSGLLACDACVASPGHSEHHCCHKPHANQHFATAYCSTDAACWRLELANISLLCKLAATCRRSHDVQQAITVPALRQQPACCPMLNCPAC